MNYRQEYCRCGCKPGCKYRFVVESDDFNDLAKQYAKRKVDHWNKGRTPSQSEYDAVATAMIECHARKS